MIKFTVFGQRNKCADLLSNYNISYKALQKCNTISVICVQQYASASLFRIIIMKNNVRHAAYSRPFNSMDTGIFHSEKRILSASSDVTAGMSDFL